MSELEFVLMYSFLHVKGDPSGAEAFRVRLEKVAQKRRGMVWTHRPKPLRHVVNAAATSSGETRWFIRAHC